MDVVAELEAMREKAEHTAVSFSLGVDEDHGADEHRRREYLKIANAAERQIYALRQAIDRMRAEVEADAALAEMCKNETSVQPSARMDSKQNPFYPK